MYVHHPDKDYDATERIGSRLVRFESGRAEVTVPGVLRHYRRAGYVLTDGARRPAAAGQVDPIEEPAVVVLDDDDDDEA